MKEINITLIQNYIQKSSLLQEILEQMYMDGIKFYIAGGSVLSSVQDTKGITTKFNDLDLYFETSIDHKKAYDILNAKTKEDNHTEPLDFLNDLSDGFISSGPVVYEQLSNSACTEYKVDDTTIQLIKLQFGKPEILVKLFDLDNSKYWSYYPFNKAYTEQDEDTLYNLKTDYIDNFWAVERISKYFIQKSINFDKYNNELFNVILNDSIDYEAINLNYDRLQHKDKTLSLKFLNFCAVSDSFLQLIDQKAAQGHRLNWEEMIKGHNGSYIDFIRFDKLDDILPAYLIRTATSFGIKPIFEKMKKQYPEYLL